MVRSKQFLKANIEKLVVLISGPTANDESAAFSIDILTWAVQDAKSNAKVFVDAYGFHYLAWFLARANSAPDAGADTLLARVRAADLAARVCEISQWYLDAALEAGILGALLSQICNREATVRAAALSALIACVDMLEEIAKVAPESFL
ncbi:g9549 [Coccomyxa viridis]|uniref:G9549 protein n=1 Tax=Coccomyxa viridis TaxID=1274662 RepID=A0ABP1G7T4_9CHLO